MGRLLEHAPRRRQATEARRGRRVAAALAAAVVAFGCDRCARPSPSPQGPTEIGPSSLPPVPPPAISKDAPCPPEMARLPGGGCIDRYEASLARGALGGLDGRDTTGVAASVEGRVPIAQVTLAQARRLCENAVKRLCSEKEWQSACRPVGVTQHFSYPYGSRFEAGRCNDWTASASGTRGPAPAGSFVRCVTAEGVYDLSGNLVEWAWPAEERDGFVAVHGGSFNHTQSDASCDEDDYKVPVAGGTHADIGFRCCL